LFSLFEADITRAFAHNHRDTEIAVLERYESNLRDFQKELGRFKATAPIKIIYIDISFSSLSSFTNSQCRQMFETTVGSLFPREKRRFKVDTSEYPKYLCYANYKLYHTKFVHPHNLRIAIHANRFTHVLLISWISVIKR